MDQEVYLKNVTQIGTPGPSGKIYIADDAYERIHMDDYRDVRVFVLMGHTECSAGKYTTFIEAAITVDDITFIRSIPVWTNQVWNRIYMEIKRAYDNMIIVGWAMDQKGNAPVATHELESIHREHFGGANQVLLLLDSEQQEERFYLSRNNHLYPKEGFYIYYSCGRPKEQPSEVQLELPPKLKTVSEHGRRGRRLGAEDSEQEATDLYGSGQDIDSQKNHSGDAHHAQSQQGSSRGQYRAMLAAQQHRHKNKSAGRFNALAAMVTAVLVAGIVVTGIRKDPERAAQMDMWIETISNSVRGSAADTNTADSEHVIYFTTEEDGADAADVSTTESAETGSTADEGSGSDQASEDGADAQQTSGEVIPVEEVDGGL